MKITIVTGFFLPVPPVAGGATEKIWHRLADEFTAAGHAITFISRTWPGFPDRESVAGVTYIRLPGADHTPSLVRNLWRDFWWGVRVARALPAADFTICNLVALPVWLGCFKPTAGQVVAVVARMPKGQGRLYGGVDLLFSLSAAVTARLIAENPRLAPRIVPFPFPIDWTRHAQIVVPPRADAPLTIGYIGRIHPEKGLRLLLDAAVILAAHSDLPPWRLGLLGPWSVQQGGGGEAYRDTLLHAYRTQLGARLTLTGPEFDPDRLARHYASLDIFCYPSLAEKGETFGVAVAEAMAARSAVVVSALPCFNELVRDGETGVVFDHTAPDAPARLAAALARMLHSSDFRRAVALRGQAHARQFDYAASARAILSRLAATPSHAT